MSDVMSITPRFNRSAEPSSPKSDVQFRLDEAMRRMAKSFEKNEPHLTQAKYRDLLTKQGTAPELKPDFGNENPSERLWKAANYQVKQDHHLRCAKIMKVAQRMRGLDRDLER